MILKRERPETDELCNTKISGCEGKIFVEMSITRHFLQFFADTITKMSENIFAYSCVSE